MVHAFQETYVVVHALQETLGFMHERQMTSVFMHVRKLWLGSSINRAMSKHSQHTTGEEQQKAREKESLAQEKSDPHRKFYCERNSEPICESVSYK